MQVVVILVVISEYFVQESAEVLPEEIFFFVEFYHKESESLGVFRQPLPDRWFLYI